MTPALVIGIVFGITGGCILSGVVIAYLMRPTTTRTEVLLREAHSIMTTPHDASRRRDLLVRAIEDQLHIPPTKPVPDPPPPTTQEKADALRARLMGKLNEAQQARLFEAEAALARFVQDYGPYAALALPLAAAPAITALDDWKP